MSTDWISQVTAMSVWEALAVVLAIAYLVLAAKEQILCWLCALLSTAIYIALFWNVSLLMESVLNVYYLLMAAYGWQQWSRGDLGSAAQIHTWSGRRHLFVIGAVLICSGICGYLLSQNTSAAWPYVDSFTTFGAVVTTWMVTRKVLENWLYWLVVDAISIPLYLDRGLLLTAGLFAVYLVIVVFGYFSWRQRYTGSGFAAA